MFDNETGSFRYLLTDLSPNTTYSVQLVYGTGEYDSLPLIFSTEATEYHLADGKGFEQSVTAATYGLTGLSPNTTYTFTLIASNATHSSSEYTYTVTTAPRWHL